MIAKINTFLFIIFFISFEAFAQIPQVDLLKEKDVSTIMQQIFDQHVDQRQITSQILKNSFKVYIDQFDPDRQYLLDYEVQPYLQLSDNRVNTLIGEYKNNNFEAFEKLNQTIQNAILRARAIRGALQRDLTTLFKSNELSDHYDEWNDPDLKVGFANDEKDLKKRIKKEIVEFINAEKHHFGDSAVLDNKTQTFMLLDKSLMERENQYLYRDDKDVLLPIEHQKNFFVMHVLKALASSLDAHTSFYSQTEAYDMKVRLEKEFEGIGVTLQQSPNGSILINSLVANAPAEKSGKVKVNDILVGIDGKNIIQEPFEKVMDMIRGDVGTDITLSLKRKSDVKNPEETVQVVLKREEITVNEDRVDTTFERFENGIIGTITLHSFYQGSNGVNSENDVRDAIKKLEKEGNLIGLIFDLRENSGGFLGQAVKVAGLFITNGVVVISKYFNGEERFYRDLDGRTTYNGPMIVLTSKATASAAEIVAQALQDYGVALIVGDERTYGKGTIQSQTVTENTASSFFKVTVGKYYTVSGKTPQINGVKADIIVPGPFNYEHIGEQYLEKTISPDTIPADYADTLADINPDLKAWFLRYYMPTLQQKKEQWLGMVGTLKTNSSVRLSKDLAYQEYIKALKDNKAPPKESKSKDYQQVEAVKIMEDMITLEIAARNQATQASKPLTAGYPEVLKK